MRIIVIGGGAAGMSAAARAKRTNPSADVVVYEEGRFLTFGLCGIPYFISDEVKT
ncbi:MAG TPA: FAD-binding protein, partial [candidate division WOR-3 bacterium]|nr:FAD-binding protein [candidate division WOR-3 bacterium]